MILYTQNSFDKQMSIGVFFPFFFFFFFCTKKGALPVAHRYTKGDFSIGKRLLLNIESTVVGNNFIGHFMKIKSRLKFYQLISCG